MATRKTKPAQSEDLNTNPIDGTFEDTTIEQSVAEAMDVVESSRIENPHPVDNPNRKAIVTDVFKTTLTLTFESGETLALDVSKMPQELLYAAALHGCKQKLVDAAAIGRDPDTGRSATAADKFAAVETVFNRITHPTNPSWNVQKGEGGVSVSGGGYLVAALCEFTGKPHATIKAWVDTLDGKQKAAMRASADIAPIIARMQAEKEKVPAKAVDSLFDALATL